MQPWPNWTPPDDFQLDGDRPPPDRLPPPPLGPDTDLLLSVSGHSPGENPIGLLVPYRLHGDNAPIPAKGVAGIGPQTGDALNIMWNSGTQILPGWQRYLEMGGQNQVGILPRTVPVEHNQLWDAQYVLNPGVEVV